jgi:c-di-GMP-binding flagellar brake protein YcgR
MKVDDQQLLRDAIARNAGAVISLPTGNELRHHKTRLIAAEDDGFWIQLPQGARTQMGLVMERRQTVGLSVISSACKVVMSSLVLQFRAGLQLNEHISVDAALLAWPAQVAAIQRRASYRASVRLDADLPVTVWCIADDARLTDAPEDQEQREVILRNLSVDGLGLICVVYPEVPPPGLNQRLRVRIVHAGTQLLLAARVRHVRPLPNGNVAIGAQFEKLELTVENRPTLAALTHLVSQLQRDEIRRHRFVEPISRAG